MRELDSRRHETVYRNSFFLNNYSFDDRKLIITWIKQTRHMAKRVKNRTRAILIPSSWRMRAHWTANGLRSSQLSYGRVRGREISCDLWRGLRHHYSSLIPNWITPRFAMVQSRSTNLAIFSLNSLGPKSDFFTFPRSEKAPARLPLL